MLYFFFPNAITLFITEKSSLPFFYIKYLICILFWNICISLGNEPLIGKIGAMYMMYPQPKAVALIK